MSAKRKSFRVKNGNSHLTVSPWKHPATGAERWRFAYRPEPGADWKYRVFKTKAEAEAEAEKKLEKLASATNALDELTPARRRWLEEVNRGVSPHDESRVLDYIRAMAKTSNITAAVDRFVASKTSKAGEETPHLANLRGVLEHFAAHFPGRSVADIHLPDMQAWFDLRSSGRGWKRRKDIRAAIVQFYRWARLEGIAGNEVTTVAQRLPEIGGEHGDRLILSPEEFQQLAQVIGEQYRPWLVLGAFAGLRPEEISPSPAKKSGKRGLRCEEINWKFNSIHIAPEVSKVPFPRTVPLSETCRAWLQWAGIQEGMTGPVCLTNPSQSKELARVATLVFSGSWPKDILRHSYGSYRNAIIRNMPALAEEMGTSVSMLHRHYHNPQPEEIGKRWFALRPGVPICSDEAPRAEQKSESAAG